MMRPQHGGEQAENAYPQTPMRRSRWIAERRGLKNALDPFVPYAFLWEEETGADGGLVPTATILLTNKECPYRCLMCDLWQNTLDERTPRGAIPTQIRHALDRVLPVRQIKLYNAGSFFDPAAIPPQEDQAIAALLAPFERVIVECHPALVGERGLRFRDRLNGRLEVAIGLETMHAGVLDALNKRFTVQDFEQSAAFLQRNDIDLRVFLLVGAPFMSPSEGLEWAQRSLDFAFACGATACTLIPTRGGVGAMEALAAAGQFAPPDLRSLEAAQEYGLASRPSTKSGRVFADTWDLPRFYTCACSIARAQRIETMNRTQTVPPPVQCLLCGAA